MKSKKSLAIIGYSGFVGGNVCSHLQKKKFKISKFNSKNIKSIYKKKYHSLIFAGLPATKWKINLNPKKDVKNIKKILQLLKTIKVDRFILISTIDIYNHKEPYGFNRLNFEKKISEIFNNLIIIRLPALFGSGLKKNIVFDLMNNNEVHKINPGSYYQWLDISNLNLEIEKILSRQKFGPNKIIELFTEPIRTKEIFKIAKINMNPNLKFEKVVKYNQIPKNGYYRKKFLVINDLKKFINQKSKIKRAVSLLILKNYNKDINYLLDCCKKNRINYIEIPLTLIFKNFIFNKSVADKFIKKLIKYDIKVSSVQSIFFGKKFNIFNKSQHKQILNHLRKVCIISKKLGAKNIIFGSPKNRIKGTLSKQDAEKISINIFKKISILCYKYNINFCLEPNAKSYGCDFINKLNEANKILKKVNYRNFLINVDTGNIFQEHNVNSLPKIKNENVGNYQISEKKLGKLNKKNTKHQRILEKFSPIDSFVSMEQKGLSRRNILQEIRKFNKIVDRLDVK